MLKNEKWAVLAGIAIAVLVYFPMLKGAPIWDDVPEWFFSPLIDLSYQEIFSSYAWPGTIALQKLLFSIFQFQFHAYHALSLALHLVNSILVIQILKEVRFPQRIPVFYLFLLHPANVITVSWMIQIKTLVCFLFGALGVLSYLRFRREKVGYSFFGLGYLLSLLFKSVSITLPALAVFKLEKFLTRRNILLGGLVGLIGVVFVFRLYSSGQVVELGAEIFPEGMFSTRVRSFVRIIRYYFFQSILPFDTIPVKDLNIGIFFLWDLLVCMGIYSIIFQGTKALHARALLAAYLFLLPVLSIVPAPFMNHTLVGDHHLYLALPLFLVFFFSLPVKKEIIRTILTAGLLLFYVVKVRETIGYFRNDEVFYSSILEEYPASVSMALNLSAHYEATGRKEKGLKVIEDLETRAKRNPRIKRSRYFKHVEEFKKGISKSEN